MMLAVNPKTNDTERSITFHVDMDSFFASVGVRERPELKALPVVVGSDPKGGVGRGVVSTLLQIRYRILKIYKCVVTK